MSFVNLVYIFPDFNSVIFGLISFLEHAEQCCILWRSIDFKWTYTTFIMRYNEYTDDSWGCRESLASEGRASRRKVRRALREAQGGVRLGHEEAALCLSAFLRKKEYLEFSRGENKSQSAVEKIVSLV